METTITATELARGLSDILNRVRYRGERFIVERGGEPVAVLEPVGVRPAATLGEFMLRLSTLPIPDEGFANDLEEVQASQPPAGDVGWD